MKEWWKDILVSINNSYGDPFTDIQIMDTYDKVRKLQEADMHFCVCTKAVPSKEAWDIIGQMRDVPSKNMILEYSLTGLDEGGFSFDERREAIRHFYEIFGQVAIMMRPLIAGKNDNIRNLSKIIDVAAETGKKVIIGGIHDKNKRKQFDSSIIQMIKEICNQTGVKYFFKTSCTAASQFEIPCWVHELGTVRNLEIAEKLGYEICMVDDEKYGKGIVVHEATTGDLNFLRILTGTKVFCERLLNNYNILSFSTEEHIFECTSSWFSWSNNVPCSVACDYCIIKNIEYLLNNRTVGCFPKDLVQFAKADSEFVRQMKNRKIHAKYAEELEKKYICYEDLRTVQVCEAKGGGAIC